MAVVWKLKYELTISKFLKQKIFGCNLIHSILFVEFSK